jgi:hypothetical protein
LGIVAVLALGAGAVVAGGPDGPVPRLLFGDGVDYSSVTSIKTSREYQDPALLEKAWALPVAQKYKPGFESQRNGSFCGPASAVDLMRSLDEAAEQGTVLDGTGLSTVFGLRWGGVTLEQLADLLRKKTGKQVTVLRDLSLTQLRAELAHANEPGRRYIVNFHRGPLFGRGGGHFSPVAAYLGDDDLVLVADVNARYKPWLVHTDRLFAAIDTVDKATGKKRGLLLVE